ncbi:uncharacterized protein [Porites lutea]|uniref:uncharacterized protein n=1 Tax=Porites lutea TaxID=51062 RepID=UPI003CC5ACA3
MAKELANNLDRDLILNGVREGFDLIPRDTTVLPAFTKNNRSALRPGAKEQIEEQLWEPITIPKRIKVKIPWSKADRKAKGVTLTLWSNPLCKDLSPVRAIIAWLLVADICSGYLFPRICKNNLTSLRNSARGITTYRKTFFEMSKALFEKEFTTHSIRRSAARWAARCGADDSTIKRAGRWKCSAFELYTQDARAEIIKEQHDGNVLFDHKLWMFKPLR